MYEIPTTIVIDGKEFPIRCRGDYRMVLDCFVCLNDTELTEQERLYSALIIFYEDFNDLADFKKSMLQAWYDTLDGIEQEFEVKAENIAVFIKELNAEIEALKQEEERLRARRKAKENKAESLKDYLKSCMICIGRLKIDTVKARISIRNNPEAA